MSVYAFRLHRGDDLLGKLREYAKEKNIRAGVVLSCVGCVTMAVIRDAGGKREHTLEERLEILSVHGTVSEKRTHLHVTFGREDLSTVGGHLRMGCIVNTTCEVVLQTLPAYEFDAEWDETTGYDELLIREF